MPEHIPKLASMNPTHHYKSQAGAYDRLLDNGPLTDRKIAKYKKQGYFSGTVNDPRLVIKEHAKTKRAVKSERQATARALRLTQLAEEYE